MDGRRSEELEAWLNDCVGQILAHHPMNAHLLDIACGAGFVLRACRNLFDKSTGIDISEEMVKCAAQFCDVSEVRDCTNTGYAPETFSFATCFAGLHHLADLKSLMQEVHRILVPGGVFYSDHDMELHFYKRFRLPLGVYRRLCGGENHYKKMDGITDEIYNLTEYNANGIDSLEMAAVMKEIGFSEVNLYYHWYGLTGITDSVFGKSFYGRGWAPLLRIVAVK
jgi:ubiquinone/menaquinone biosynthesis C-methylase UbiE